MEAQYQGDNVLILADDFTGANDAAVNFALNGAQAMVMFHPDNVPQAQVVAVNTDSRALAANQAEQAIKAAINTVGLPGHSHWLVKKIDSTLRGNPGAEVSAALQASGLAGAVVALASPGLGRTTTNGQCLVKGIPVNQTEFASDPKTPVTDADIIHVLQQQAERVCYLADLACVRQGNLAATLQACFARGVEVVVVDSETAPDLTRVIEAVASLPVRPLLAGSAGICEALAQYLFPQAATSPLLPHSSGPLLAVVGSMSEIAQQQMQAVMQHPLVAHMALSAEQVLSAGSESYLHECVQAAVAALNSGRHCVISTTEHHDARHQVARLCQRYQLNRAQLGEKLCLFLGRLTQAILSDATPGGMYLSGGDVAIAVARVLGAQGFTIHGRIAECVPWGEFTGSQYLRPVMTKAGGFGNTDTLLEVVHFFEEKTK